MPNLSRKIDAALRAAIYHQDLIKIKELISNGADVTSVDNTGKTPLHYARTPEIVNILLLEGANPNIKDKYGITPLYNIQDETAIQYLLDAGADATIIDDNGFSPLHQTFPLSIVTMFVDAGADPTAINNMRMTPLHYAFDSAVVEYLLLAGADATIVNTNGDTPLHLCHDKKSVELLVEAGSDLNSPNEQQKTPLHCARNSEVLLALLDHGALPNLLDCNGQTALHLAQDAQSVVALIEQNANVTIQDKDGKTPLHYVYDAKAVEILCNAGADINATDATGKTPLHYARNSAIAVQLLNYGADPTALDNDNQTPLDNAASYQTAALLNFAIEAYTIHDIESCSQITIVNYLYKAIEYGLTPLCINLLELIENVEDVMQNGQTPLHCPQDATMTYILLEYGVNPLIKDRSKQTALDYAKLNCDSEAINMLEIACFSAELSQGLVAASPAEINETLRLALQYRLSNSCAELVATGADPFTLNDYEENTFDIVIAANNSNALKLIFNSMDPAVLSALLHQNNNLLYSAMMHQSMDCVKLLIEYGVDLLEIGSDYSWKTTDHEIPYIVLSLAKVHNVSEELLAIVEDYTFEDLVTFTRKFQDDNTGFPINIQQQLEYLDRYNDFTTHLVNMCTRDSTLSKINELRPPEAVYYHDEHVKNCSGLEEVYNSIELMGAAIAS